jgi:hypothetical protein
MSIGVHATSRPAARFGTILRIFPRERMANQMMQIMFALAVQRLARTTVCIEGYDLPEWGLRKPPASPDVRALLTVGDASTKASVVAKLIDRYRPKRIDLTYLVTRASNYLPSDSYQCWFPLRVNEGISTSAEEIVIHVRLGDVAQLSHPHYGPLPISYYRSLLDRTGLSPVFMGELTDSPYCAALRSAFPRAKFLSTGTVLNDFQTIRRAHHIALAVSSFSWIAAYLSCARSIHMPVCGWFDCRELPKVDMLPTNEGRWTFYDVPRGVWHKRYDDFYAEGAQFPFLSAFEITKRRLVANAKIIGIRSRIRLGAERRLIGESLSSTIDEIWHRRRAHN